MIQVLGYYTGNKLLWWRGDRYTVHCLPRIEGVLNAR